MTSPRPAFLLSLPRSGSTLLQRMLGAHPAISTRAEPWVLLPLLSAFDERGVYARYNHRVAQRALRSFADHFNEGEDAYFAQVGQFAQRLYAEAADVGAEVFVDKTPRYGLYTERMLRAFPSAPMIVLWRNPLSILGSLSRSFDDGRWTPYHHVVDLYDLLESLTAAVADDPGRFHQVRYEDLVENPTATLGPLLAHLGLPWDDRVRHDFAATDVRGPVGDMSARGTLTTSPTVSTVSAERWQADLASPVRRHWARRYLDWIGGERLRLMGYDPATLRQQLLSQPTRWSTVPADLYDAAKGVAWRLLEPQILRDKWAQRHGRMVRITSHA